MRIALILCTLIILGGCATSPGTWWDQEWEPLHVQVDSTQVTYQWTPPTSGSTVVYYDMETTLGQHFTATRAKKRITVPADSPHRVRVRGVDAHGVTGPWSVYSNTWPGISEADTLDIDNPVGEREWQR